MFAMIISATKKVFEVAINVVFAVVAFAIMAMLGAIALTWAVIVALLSAVVGVAAINEAKENKGSVKPMTASDIECPTHQARGRNLSEFRNLGNSTTIIELN